MTGTNGTTLTISNSVSFTLKGASSTYGAAGAAAAGSGGSQRSSRAPPMRRCPAAAQLAGILREPVTTASQTGPQRATAGFWSNGVATGGRQLHADRHRDQPARGGGQPDQRRPDLASADLYCPQHRVIDLDSTGGLTLGLRVSGLNRRAAHPSTANCAAGDDRHGNHLRGGRLHLLSWTSDFSGTVVPEQVWTLAVNGTSKQFTVKVGDKVRRRLVSLRSSPSWIGPMCGNRNGFTGAGGASASVSLKVDKDRADMPLKRWLRRRHLSKPYAEHQFRRDGRFLLDTQFAGSNPATSGGRQFSSTGRTGSQPAGSTPTSSAPPTAPDYDTSTGRPGPGDRSPWMASFASAPVLGAAEGATTINAAMSGASPPADPPKWRPSPSRR